jgi:transposase
VDAGDGAVAAAAEDLAVDGRVLPAAAVAAGEPLAEERVDAVVAADEHLRASRELLRTIPGVGPVAATAILAELPDPSRFATAQQAAAYAGLAPREYRSGTSVKKRTWGGVPLLQELYRVGASDTHRFSDASGSQQHLINGRRPQRSCGLTVTEIVPVVPK